MEELSAFVINLESRKDRRIQMEKQLSRAGLHAEFFPAVRPDGAGDFETIGTRGCFLSHLEVLKLASNHAKHLLIMEDDLDFITDFFPRWEVAYGALRETDWSIFYPGHLISRAPPGLHKVSPQKGLWCAHFLMFNKNAIGPVANALEMMLSRPSGHELGGPMHVDAAYNWIRKQNPQLATYLFSPALGYQRASRSDISAHRWFDEIKPLRPLIDFLRKFKKSGTHSQPEDFL
jgi:glycosyl transferase, family 25